MPRTATTIRPYSAQSRFKVFSKTSKALEATVYSKREQEMIDRPVKVTAVLMQHSVERAIYEFCLFASQELGLGTIYRLVFDANIILSLEWCTNKQAALLL